MYASEGKHPSRRSHTALLHLRQSNSSLYNTGGLLPTNGQEWAKIRKPLQKPVTTAVAASNFIPCIDEVMKDAIKYIHESRETLSDRDFIYELEKIFMEVTGVITLDHRLDSLHLDLDQESIPAKLIKAADETNSNVLATDNGLPFWKIFETKQFKIIKKSQAYMASIARKFLQEKQEDMSLETEGSSERKTLLEHWLRTPDLDLNDVATGVEDFLLAGVHTAAFSLGFFLYHIANNERVQHTLREECTRVLEESDDEITKQTLTSAKYAAPYCFNFLPSFPFSV